MAVAGSASWNLTRRGTLYGAMFSRDQAISSASVSAMPLMRTMWAQTTSPLSGSGIGVTATCRMAGWRDSSASTSSGNTL